MPAGDMAGLTLGSLHRGQRVESLGRAMPVNAGSGGSGTGGTMCFRGGRTSGVATHHSKALNATMANTRAILTYRTMAPSALACSGLGFS